MRPVSMMSFLSLAAFGATAPAHAGDCSGRWEVFSSRPYEQIALPDTHVNYWRIRFKVPTGAPVALRIKGAYPHARYANFNVYDQTTQDSSASLADVRIEPDAGSLNPFRPGVGRDAAPRDYTVWMLPGAPEADDVNIVRQPPPRAGADEQLLELWYRVYVPDRGDDGGGGAALPLVEAFRDETAAEPVACPEPAAREPSLTNALQALPPENPAGLVNMYRTRATGLYANLDNLYLATRFGWLQAGNVVVLRFRPPTFADASATDAPFATRDVRYWSFCLGGIDQRTSACLKDAALRPGADGFATVTIGAPELRALAESRGQNFLPWGQQILQVLVYRNLLTLPRFAGSVAKVRVYEPRGEARDFAAQQFIGEYAPAGRTCKKDAYKSGNCGMP